MCDIDVVMLFLILASIITMAVDSKEDDCKTILSSCWKYNLLFFSLLTKLKENQSGKLSTILESRKSSRWRGENEGKTPYNLLLELIRWPLTIVLWQFVSMLIEWGRCYETLWTWTIFILFSFIFWLYRDFVFFFLLFLDNEEAHDTEVTWHVTWCDVIDLESSRRIYKMTLGHMYTTWWSWGKHEEVVWIMRTLYK